MPISEQTVQAGETIEVPPYVTLLDHVSRRLHINRLCFPWLLSALPAACYELLRTVRGDFHRWDDVLPIYVGPAIAALGTTLLLSAYSACCTAAAQFRPALVTPEQTALFRANLRRMFRSDIQNRYAAAFGVSGTVLVILMSPVLTSLLYHLIVIAGAAWFFIVSGYGLGLAITTMHWIRSIPSYGRIKTFIIPSRTTALGAVSRLTGIFALYFSAQSLAEILLFLNVRWENHAVVIFVMTFVMVPVIAVAVVFFFYPQFAIRNVILRSKQNALEELAAIGDATNAADIATRLSIAKLFQEIDDSSDFALDFSTAFRFASSIVLPVASFIFSQWNTISVLLASWPLGE